MRTFVVFLFASLAWGQSTCLNFPSGLIPLSSVAYVTAPNASGDQLVVGALANGLNTLSQIPLPNNANDLFCDASIQLAPQQFFPSVYVPSAAERNGDFSAFSGLIVEPGTNVPFPGGRIPIARLGAVFAFRVGAVQTSDTARNWTRTGSLSSARCCVLSTRLPDGKVLVLGLQTTADIYDPTTGVFRSVGPTRAAHGANATATLLNNGRVLIVGGTNAPTTAELFDPVSGQFSLTGAMTQPHGYCHSSTLLADGRVLVVGGLITTGNGGTNTDTNSGAELYDPTAGTFAAAGPMSSNRNLHTATLLADGRVLIAGGYTKGANAPNNSRFDTAELFTPAFRSFTRSGSMAGPRAAHFAVRLPNDKVLVGGGDGDDSSAELYDLSTQRFVPTGSMASTARSGAFATLLPNGLVLVSGGQSFASGPTADAELYNPASGVFLPTGSLTIPRFNAPTTLLLDGRVLTAGGLSRGYLAVQSADIYTPVVQGLVASQTGLTFRAAQGASTIPTQNVAILSPTDTIPYNVAVKTFTGGGWLKATPTSSTSGPGTQATLTITADPTNLAATDYYGTVTLSPTDGKHPPISIAIVLTIVPAGANAAPSITPAGLVFTGTTGASPASKTFTISNVTSRALTFTTAANASPAFFDYNAKLGSIGAGITQTFTVTPTSASLAAGVYRGSIRFSFGDGTTQSVDILLVLSAPATSAKPEAAPRGAGGCTPTKLLPVLTSIGSGFATPLAWPTPVIAQVVDDCGTAINSGSVNASFTNGDLPISLVSIGGGTWSATWVPVRASTSTTVRADARSANLSGTVQAGGAVASNPKVPVVAAGGVLSSGDYIGSPAQGLLASIFGVALADGVAQNSALPLPQQLGSTIVSVSGVTLPVLFVSENQVNVLIPYELASNTPHQLIVQRGNAVSVPVPISIFDNQPAVLATAGNGKGQGHIYKIVNGAQILADSTAPAKAGDVLVIYCVGLGPVDPPLKSGDPAPLTRLEPITGTASVTLGGVPAAVAFAGLTPGFSGLYQMNATVPSGIAAGSSVPVSIAVNGRAGAGNIVMAIQ